jgi:MoaA/NifB/PqqE/SkfB family radical SAM enzyme
MQDIMNRLEEWLTDSGLTPAGQKCRKTYSELVKYLAELPVPLYRVSRALHLLQSNIYETSQEGFALPPHTINLCVNNRCNLRCSYCDLNHGRHGDGTLNTKVMHNVINKDVLYELPLEIGQKIIDESAWYRPTIRVPWMEPLLYRNLLPLIRYTKQKGLPFSMLTNGLLLHKFATRLAAAGVAALRVSLDGPQEIHDELCGVKGTFKQVIKGLKLLVYEKKQAGLDLQIGCYYTVNDKNHHTMIRFLQELEDHGLLDEMFIGFYMFNYISKHMVELHNKNHAQVCGATVEETSAQYADLSRIEIPVLLRQREEIELEYISKGARIHFRPGFTEANLRSLLHNDNDIFPDSRCETHWHTLFINPQGEIKPLPQCILKPVGNVYKQSLLDIWNGERMREQRLKLREYGAYYGCMRCWSIYSNIEDMQGTWHDNTDGIKAGSRSHAALA